MKRKCSMSCLLWLAWLISKEIAFVNGTEIFRIPEEAWQARDIPTSYANFFRQLVTQADGNDNSQDNLFPFGVLTPDGYKSKYFLPDFTRENADVPMFMPSKVKFEMYTRKNRHLPQEFTIFTMHKLRHSNFNPRRRSKFIYPTINSNPSFEAHIQMKDAFLDVEDMNIFIINWAIDAVSISYFRILIRGQKISAVVAKFIDRLPPSPEIHILGNSLACHLAGFVGKLAKTRIHRITGLDPAGPPFQSLPPTERLDRSDAIFVDIVHTDGGLPKYGHSGMTKSIGHVDFYINGARLQPGCGTADHNNFVLGWCSHWKAAKYYLDTIKGHQYLAYSCSPTISNFHQAPVIPFGEFVPRSATGDYCLQLGERPEDSEPHKLLLQKLIRYFPGIDMRKITA